MSAFGMLGMAKGFSDYAASAKDMCAGRRLGQHCKESSQVGNLERLICGGRELHCLNSAAGCGNFPINRSNDIVCEVVSTCRKCATA